MQSLILKKLYNRNLIALTNKNNFIYCFRCKHYDEINFKCKKFNESIEDIRNNQSLCGFDAQYFDYYLKFRYYKNPYVILSILYTFMLSLLS